MLIAGTTGEPRQLTAREEGEGMQFWRIGQGESRGRGREGIGVRPVFSQGVLDGLAPAVSSSELVADWLELDQTPLATALELQQHIVMSGRGVLCSPLRTLMTSIHCSPAASFRHLERQC